MASQPRRSLPKLRTGNKIHVWASRLCLGWLFDIFLYISLSRNRWCDVISVSQKTAEVKSRKTLPGMWPKQRGDAVSDIRSETTALDPGWEGPYNNQYHPIAVCSHPVDEGQNCSITETSARTNGWNIPLMISGTEQESTCAAYKKHKYSICQHIPLQNLQTCLQDYLHQTKENLKRLSTFRKSTFILSVEEPLWLLCWKISAQTSETIVSFCSAQTQPPALILNQGVTEADVWEDKRTGKCCSSLSLAHRNKPSLHQLNSKTLNIFIHLLQLKYFGNGTSERTMQRSNCMLQRLLKTATSTFLALEYLTDVLLQLVKYSCADCWGPPEGALIRK